MEIQPEDLSLEQIKEQLALYSRLYYQKRRDDKDFMDKKRANAIRHIRRKKLDDMAKNGQIDLKDIEQNEKPKEEESNDGNLRPTKPRKYKGNTYKILSVE